MPIRINGSTSGYIEIDAPASAPNLRYVVPNDFGFPSGTVLLFHQTTAPTGWTKLTTHNDKALRIVSGTVGSGGATAFSAVMNGSVGATTLTTAQIPSHAHQISSNRANSSFYNTFTIVTGNFFSSTTGTSTTVNVGTDNTGGGGSHTHTMDVAYVDVIMASKD
jgi:hypothetical protein